MNDLISRQAAIDAICQGWCELDNDKCKYPFDPKQHDDYFCDGCFAVEELKKLPSAQPEPQWIPCSERLPEELEVVNVTWVNHKPEPYYESIKDVPFTASAVYYGGKWHWYSSITADVLAEYGKYESEEFDDAIECIAWMPLPEPWKGEQP